MTHLTVSAKRIRRIASVCEEHGLKEVCVDDADFTWAYDPRFPDATQGAWGHESWLLPYLETPTGGCYLDVGTFTGCHAVKIARLCGAEVFCFEPIPEHVAMIKANAALNGCQLHVISKAVSSKAGEATFITRDYGSDVCGSMASHIEAHTPGTIQAQVTTLDAELSQLSGADVVKVDVEGHEAFVLDGAVELASRYRPRFVIEVHGGFEGCSHNGNLIHKWATNNRYAARRIFDGMNGFHFLELVPV